MRRVITFAGLTLASLATLFFLGCGGGYSGGSYGGGGGGGTGIATSIVITPTSASISMGATKQFTAVTKDSSGNTLTGVPLVWKSSNTAVATVSGTGLATSVGLGTTKITASVTYSGGVYGMGTTYTSNMATLTVTTSDSVMGIAATGHALAGALITLKDATGKSQVAMSGDDGRFQISIAGLQAPFLLKADDGRGQVLFSAAAEAGAANLDTLTDAMLRAWYGTHGSTPEAAFADMAAHPAPDAKSLAALDKNFSEVLAPALAAEGIDQEAFKLFSTSFNADSTGFDALLDNTRVTTADTHLSLDVAGSVTQISFSPGTLEFSKALADGQAMSLSRFVMP